MATLQLLNSVKLLTALFCQHQLIKDIVAVNIALNKSAIDCNNKPLSKIMFDGDTDFNRPEIINGSCFGKGAFVEIDLGGMYDIHYVVVYAGKGTDTGQLDYFEAYIGDESFFVECSEFWGPSVISDRGMRLNCETSYALRSKVKILSRMKEELSISEIEVHTLASGFPGDKPNVYRGCFTNFGENKRDISGSLFTGCQRDCSSSGYLFFGIKNNTLCHCLSYYDDNDEIPFEACNMVCDDGINNCGGKDAFSVYLASVRLPTYKGCLEVSESSLNSRNQGSMTVLKCLHHCDNYNFALLMDGNSCFCLNDTVPSTGSRYASCTIECSGNSNEFCGGNGHLSVYETCLKRMYESIQCSKLFKCAYSYDMYGLCIGSCKIGFLGDYCMERAKVPPSKGISKTTLTRVPITDYSHHAFPVLSTIEKKYTLEINCQDWNQCRNIINTECIIQKGKAKCICTMGYIRTDELSECEDIDECMFEPCDIRNALCYNTNGSYVCNCLSGYSRKISNDICVANESVVNEMVISHSHYWFLLASIAPLLSAVVLLTFLSFYASSANRESDINHSEPEINRKASDSVSSASEETEKN